MGTATDDSGSCVNAIAEMHEVARVFADEGWRLNETLVAMLNEHFTHRTERRGCGFTQASRHVAEFVNRRRQPFDYDEIRLFGSEQCAGIVALIAAAREAGLELRWREIDRHSPEAALVKSPLVQGIYDRETIRYRALREIDRRMEFEESRVVAALIADCVLGAPSAAGDRIPSWPERLEIGTCPLAERYFLEVAGAFVRRSGAVNVIVSQDSRPLMIEKLKLGDDHSCVTLAPVVLNDVRIPPGSLLGVKYDGAPGIRRNRSWPGQVIPLGSCQGFRFLRLTTLAVSPQNRRRAFSTHFEAQVAGGLFAPDIATVDMLKAGAMSQL